MFSRTHKILLCTLAAITLTSCAPLTCTAILRNPKCMTLALPALYSSYHYKMTVEIQTPEGIKTGHVVRKVKVKDERHKDGVIVRGDRSYTAAGEAIVIDLAERGKIFALMQGVTKDEDYATSITHPLHTSPQDSHDYEKSTSFTPFSRHHPQLVYFKDLDSPSSMVLIPARDTSLKDGLDYSSPHELSGIFGDGVFVKSVTVETTDEKVTRNIEALLPWLSPESPLYLGEDRLPEGFSKKMFSTGLIHKPDTTPHKYVR